jgi:hypothetical protein
VSGRGVQTNLLKLMEETEVPLRSPTDIQAQLQAAFEYQRRGKVKRETINTKHILFIVSGAFDQMLDIIRRRVRQADIGFGGHLAESVAEAELHRRGQTEDFVKFGFEPEFIGRLPVRVVLDKLSVEDLYNILKQSEGSVVKQYESSFSAFGIDVIFSDEGLRAVAELAALGEHGRARTADRLRARPARIQVRAAVVHRAAIRGHAALVERPEAELQRILHEPAYEHRELMRQLVHDFERKFAGETPPADAAGAGRGRRDRRARPARQQVRQRILPRVVQGLPVRPEPDQDQRRPDRIRHPQVRPRRPRQIPQRLGRVELPEGRRGRTSSTSRCGRVSPDMVAGSTGRARGRYPRKSPAMLRDPGGAIPV